MTGLEQLNNLLFPEGQAKINRVVYRPPQKSTCLCCGNPTSGKIKLPDGSMHSLCKSCMDYCKQYKHRTLMDLIYDIRVKIALGESLNVVPMVSGVKRRTNKKTGKSRRR